MSRVNHDWEISPRNNSNGAYIMKKCKRCPNVLLAVTKKFTDHFKGTEAYYVNQLTGVWSEDDPGCCEAE